MHLVHNGNQRRADVAADARVEIEAIRGVAVDGVLRTLLERELVRMMGRKADAGRPMLYGLGAAGHVGCIGARRIRLRAGTAGTAAVADPAPVAPPGRGRRVVFMMVRTSGDPP